MKPRSVRGGKRFPGGPYYKTADTGLCLTQKDQGRAFVDIGRLSSRCSVALKS